MKGDGLPWKAWKEGLKSRKEDSDLVEVAAPSLSFPARTLFSGSRTSPIEYAREQLESCVCDYCLLSIMCVLLFPPFSTYIPRQTCHS